MEFPVIRTNLSSFHCVQYIPRFDSQNKFVCCPSRLRPNIGKRLLWRHSYQVPPIHVLVPPRVSARIPVHSLPWFHIDMQYLLCCNGYICKAFKFGLLFQIIKISHWYSPLLINFCYLIPFIFRSETFWNFSGIYLSQNHTFRTICIQKLYEPFIGQIPL